MRVLYALLTAVCAVFTTAHAAIPPIVVPSDIVVTLTATPTVNLMPGQRIYFTLTVTNLGPDTVKDLIVQSSPIYGGGPNTDTIDCQNMDAEIADTATNSYYLLVWFLAGAISGDFPAGETRTCHIGAQITAQAPAVTAFSFGLPSDYVDINPSNDTATVFLQRAPEPIPALSPMMLWLLAALLAATAGVALRYRHVF